MPAIDHVQRAFRRASFAGVDTQNLAVAAEAAADCLGVGGSDRVLVLCNQRERAVAEVLVTAAGSRTRTVRLLEYPTLTRNGEEPPDHVAEAMRDASVVFATTTYSISHTRARRAATAAGARIASMRGFNEAFAQAMSVDYGLLRRDGARLAAALTTAESCRITSAAGTDVTLSLKGRQGTADDGNLRAPGAFGNLPAGEAYIAPLETVGDGMIVFDGGLADYGLLRAPLRVRLEAGSAVDADGEAADWLLSTLDAGGTHGRSIAELGIGTNPGAHLCGLVAIDEKVLGTGHLAFGTSASFGGVNQASVHIDGMIRNPTIDLDGRALVHPKPQSGGYQADE
jgi:leucyl aminopeptidase (aminopeptidase T)